MAKTDVNCGPFGDKETESQFLVPFWTAVFISISFGSDSICPRVKVKLEEDILGRYVTRQMLHIMDPICEWMVIPVRMTYEFRVLSLRVKWVVWMVSIIVSDLGFSIISELAFSRRGYNRSVVIQQHHTTVQQLPTSVCWISPFFLQWAWNHRAFIILDTGSQLLSTITVNKIL